MVQTFGKRVLGGIGAPGGGMSKAYAEGVSTGIAQRSNRQAMSAVDQEMRMREQDQQFKIEDREEAKRRRAAAEAAAGAARARSAALARALAGTVGKAPGVTIPPGRTSGPVVAVGGTTPTLPPVAKTPATGTPMTPRPPLSFESPTRVRRAPIDVAPTAGLRVSEAPMVITNIEDMQGTYDTLEEAIAGKNRVGVSMPPPVSMNRAAAYKAAQAQGGYDPLSSAAGLVASGVGKVVGGVVNAAQVVGGRTVEEQARLQAQAQAQAPVQTGVREEQGPPVAPTVTIMGPGGRSIVMPAGEAYPTGTVYGGEPTQLSFGPALGAPEVDVNASAVERVAANPPGQPMSPLNAERYTMEPGLPGRELQQTYNEREELVRQIGIYSEYGEYAAVAELTTKIKALDNTIYQLQGFQGIQELQFNSPQRLQMVLSEELGRDIGIQPNALGGYDIYADGMLAMQLDGGNGENSVAYWARGILDETFAASEAARAAEYGKLDYENQLAIQKEEAAAGFRADNIVLQGEVDMAKQQVITNFALELDRGQKVNTLELEQYKQGMVDAGLLSADANLQVEKMDTGTIVVFDMNTGKRVMQYIPSTVVDETGAAIGTAYKELKD